jgi:hypothetical protein
MEGSTLNCFSSLYGDEIKRGKPLAHRAVGYGL